MPQRWQVWKEAVPAEHKAAIARWVAGYHAPLPGDGLRLLRECMDVTRAQLACTLGVAERRVARWENQADDPLAERAVRALYLASIRDGSTLTDVCLVLEMTEEWPAWLEIQPTGRLSAIAATRVAAAPANAAPAPRAQARRRKKGKPVLKVVARAA